MTYRLEIPGWRPALTNELVGVHYMKAHRLKKRDRKQVALACMISGVPKATTRRRVRLTISGRYASFPDDDAPFKSLLDALVQCGALIDDSRQWCDWAKPEYVRGPKQTIITLENMEY